jgi:hypothetical protein
MNLAFDSLNIILLATREWEREEREEKRRDR